MDLEACEALPLSKTVVLMNSFITKTTAFLNNFATVCDEKLRSVSSNLTRLEVTLALLETKMGSIPGMDGPSTVPSDAPPVAESGAAPAAAAAPAGEDGEENPAEPVYSGPAVKDDPDYSRYFKLMRLGMPKEQVALKMSSEGFDPSALDNPDGPVPGSGGGGGGAAAPAPAAPAAAAPVAAPGAAEDSAAAGGDDSGLLKVKDDPMYKRYFKMLEMGVPPPAVRIKMGLEGVDESVLDMDPNAPSPNAHSVVVVEDADD
eukprot:PLAT8300.1.p1 GENE.PLAT8300.1~~PLAT8300.1.p1  ORF type:complete len:269 (+),score=101.52 PLAT8300.1:28-807(+)